MPGRIIVTDMKANLSRKLMLRVARNMGFSVTELDAWEYQLRRGSFGWSLFLGAVIAYCNFRVNFGQGDDHQVEISIERNSPWWTGMLGINQVKSWCKRFAEALAEAIEDEGGEILEENQF
jgi:hypothetical protein